ncbi:MAG: STAS domain-containing protein [Dechloromonas sp.]|nr:STAS domain-containing protein [Dechloromonas sp.]
MIERDGTDLRVTAPMTLDNARLLQAAGIALLQAGAWRVDLAVVTEADSSAIAVMLGWLRVAAARQATLQFVNVPAGVRSLADLYGVGELLSLA